MTDHRLKDVSAYTGRSTDFDDVVRNTREMAERVDDSLALSTQWLLGHQARSGAWLGRYSPDATTTAEYILFRTFLGERDCQECQAAADVLLDAQLSSGGWALRSGGSFDLSVSVLCYFALKCTGHKIDASYMKRARQAILVAGGADRTDSLPRFLLALLGQISYDLCAPIPPEICLLSAWVPYSLPRFRATARAILVPLSIIWSTRPRRDLDSSLGIKELFREPPENWTVPVDCKQPLIKLPTWKRYLASVWSRVLRLWEWSRVRPLRGKTLDRAQSWITRRVTAPGGLGSNVRATLWAMVALRCRTTPMSSDQASAIGSCRVFLETVAGMRFPHANTTDAGCKNYEGFAAPNVNDSSLAMRCLAENGHRINNPRILQGLEWLLDQQHSRPGDWTLTNIAPGGWSRHGSSPVLADVEITASVLRAMRTQFTSTAELGLTATSRDSLADSLVVSMRVPSGTLARRQVALLDRLADASRRARQWLLSMQNSDGGWGRYHRGRIYGHIAQVPWASSVVTVDCSSPSITGSVLAALGAWEMQIGRAAVDHAVSHFRRSQHEEGYWQEPWPCCAIQTTCRVIEGLRAVGIPHDDLLIDAAIRWLGSQQRADGAWGAEFDQTIDGGDVLDGSVTRTALAILAHVSAGQTASSSVLHGIDFLLSRQNRDGVWGPEPTAPAEATLTVYAADRYNAICLPHLALAQWRQTQPTATKIGQSP